MTGTETPASRGVAQGHAALASGVWSEAYDCLSVADREAPLDPIDVERLAMAARMLGRDAENIDLLIRAHREHLARGEEHAAARCAFWLALRFLLEGELARCSGWIARGERLLGADGECVERGYALLPIGLRALTEGDPAAGADAFARAAAIGDRYGDRDLATIGRMGHGRATIRLGDAAGGTVLLDEVMVAVTSGEVSAGLVGDIYCAVIDACHEVFDLRRAQEWTTALERWCAAQPELTPYRGVCLVRRAELLQLHGAWPDALHEAVRASDWMSRPPPRRGAGGARYELAELHRLRGESQAAEAAYREAHRLGHDPQPGLALLRLAEGKVAQAAVAMRRVIGEPAKPRERARILAAHVEVMLAAGDLDAAREASNELAALALELDAPYLRAMASQARGAVGLADGKAGAALAALREAAETWRRLDVPYEAARVRVLTGLAHRSLGDEEAAVMELDAARAAFGALGAAFDRRNVDALGRRPDAQSSSGAAAGNSPLTGREVEVVREVAAGGTNRMVAERLGISEKTVARHLSNVFTKLGLASRAAVTAYAYRHGLVDSTT
ncbi:MAG: LuxR C-terminal-related transcriptional regulator [Gemmatimonadales bacterium]